jgi:hypothetical protein
MKHNHGWQRRITVGPVKRAGKLDGLVGKYDFFRAH